MLKNYFKKQNRAFTIIEMMVAIGIFLVVIMYGMTSLLNADLIHQKSQDQRSIMDNLNFIMEDMSRNIRTGYGYRCISGNESPSNIASGLPVSCLSGGWAITFKTPESPLDENAFVYYLDNNDNLWKSVNGGASFVQLNPDGVKFITGSSFQVFGAEPNDGLQPFVIIRLAGQITSKNGSVTPFNLQTSVSQRVIDVEI